MNWAAPSRIGDSKEHILRNSYFVFCRCDILRGCSAFKLVHFFCSNTFNYMNWTKRGPNLGDALRVEGRGVPAFVAVAVKVENAASRSLKF